MKIELFHNNGARAFSWVTSKEREEPTRHIAARPGSRDLTNALVGNEELLKGLYHGNAKGLQFASPLCYTPVNLMTQMMGIPTPYSADEKTQLVLNEISAMIGSERVIRTHRGSLIVGNCWRWPRFDSLTMGLVMEAILDSVVTDIVMDIQSEQPSAILTSERIKISTGENKTVNVERKRRFEPDMVTVKWSGERPANVQDVTARNVAGILPVNFANDADEGAIRGYSVFSRTIRDLKDYHDIDYRASETLAKFKVKQIQTVMDPKNWRTQNKLDVIDGFEPTENDFVLNQINETTDYKFLPGDATAALDKALERKFWKIVEGSPIPELFWGPLATGNHASTDTQMQQAVDAANAKRKEFTPSWEAIYSGYLRIMSVLRMESYQPFEVRWNRLDAVSPAVKMQILLQFSQAAREFVSSATCSKKQLYTLWTLNFPESRPGDYETFIEGITDMAAFKQFLGEQYGSGLEDFNLSQTSKDGQA
jgi:hypothetical protein